MVRVQYSSIERPLPSMLPGAGVAGVDQNEKDAALVIVLLEVDDDGAGDVPATA